MRYSSDSLLLTRWTGTKSGLSVSQCHLVFDIRPVVRSSIPHLEGTHHVAGNGDHLLLAGHSLIFGEQERRIERLKILYKDQEWELSSGMTVRDAIKKVGLSIEEVLAVRDGRLINEETILQPDDEVKLIAVISGGTL